MNPEDNFLKHWFSAVNTYIETDDHITFSRFLENCAKACSESYSLEVYSKAFANAKNIEEALETLHNSFADFNYNLYPDKIEIIYSKCDCDLVHEKLISSNKVCHCSESSLLYNWERIYGKGNVLVILRQSILNKDSRCLFDVRIKQLGHLQ